MEELKRAGSSAPSPAGSSKTLPCGRGRHEAVQPNTIKGFGSRNGCTLPDVQRHATCLLAERESVHCLLCGRGTILDVIT
jgi:hypothetical protein